MDGHGWRSGCGWGRKEKGEASVSNWWECDRGASSKPIPLSALVQSCDGGGKQEIPVEPAPGPPVTGPAPLGPGGPGSRAFRVQNFTRTKPIPNLAPGLTLKGLTTYMYTYVHLYTYIYIHMLCKQPATALRGCSYVHMWL